MLAADSLLQALSDLETTETYTNCNDDFDFGMVLEVYADSDNTSCEVLCSDGQKRDLLIRD